MFEKKKRKSKKEAGARGPAASGGPESADAAGAAPSGEPGSRIGRYTIVSTLGQGGMGKVYLARDPVIGRNVALKVITMRPDLPDDEAAQYRERFLREAQAAGALIHPNIVAVHDVGLDPETRSPYIVMEHVPGQDLKKVILSRAPLPGAEAVALVLQIAAALDYAHKRGVVHRDIKPANILCAEQGRVKITDFGVARMSGSDLTRSDQFVGSPGFMSPEQLNGGQVDGRSDLFALGVILYQLLTGKAPFEGENVSEVLYRISTQPAEPPSERHADVSPDFDAILEKALAKDPAQRFQTGQELMAALAPLVQEEPPAAGEEEAAAEKEESDEKYVPSPWFTLNSQWRLGALVAFMMLALIGVNWAIVTFLHGSLGDSVQLESKAPKRPAREPARPSPRGSISAAGAVPPAVPGRSAGWTGKPRQAFDEARDAMKTAPQELPEPEADEIPTNRPLHSVCAMSYAGQPEINRAVESARRARGIENADWTPADHPSGRIRVEVKHRMKAGRLVVLVDGKTVLSKPFGAAKGKSGTVTHVLSVPAGKHGVEVRLLEEKGALAARSRISGTVVKNEVARLTGEQRSGTKKTLGLDWHDSH
ncbi:MAG TPA: serine/threonine-protein kinase [Candidatus Polarisedimenticolia bacterium]|nr:serine/threonine-protein kinase [Candidatus Polarisedimenticolia bacterium]